MTANQIAYQNMLENRRSNLAREQETARHNMVQERQTDVVNTETQRNNLRLEALKAQSNEYTHFDNLAQRRSVARTASNLLAETSRHNKAAEELSSLELSSLNEYRDSSLREAGRHNLATENLTAQELLERNRSNRASEGLRSQELSELSRHNRAQEGIGYISAYASRDQAAAALENARTNLRNSNTQEYRARIEAETAGHQQRLLSQQTKLAGAQSQFTQMQAQELPSLYTSQQFNNYGSGTHHITGAVSDLWGIGTSFFPGKSVKQQGATMGFK